jgi:hypothetical protein
MFLNFIIKLLSGGLLDKVIDVYELHRKGQITKAEFDAKVKIAGKDAEVEIEKAWAKTAAEVTESVQATVRSSKIIQKAYAIVLFLQLFVLVWYQLGVSAFTIVTGAVWPAPMASIEWAYLLIAAMIGAGPLVYRK